MTTTSRRPSPTRRPADGAVRGALAVTARMLRWLAAVAAAVAVVGGVPILLWAIAGRPVPTATGELSDLWAAVTQQAPVRDRDMLKVFAVIGWGAWLHVVWVFLVELGAGIAGQVPRAVRGAGLTQAAIRPLVNALLSFWMASTAVLGAAPITAAINYAHPTPASASVTVPAEHVPLHPVDPTPLHPGDHTTQPPTVTTSPTEIGGFNLAPTQSEALTVPYLTTKGDSLWAIARTHLGDPMRWTEIFDLSKDTIQPGGLRFDDPDLIWPEWVVMLPPDAVNVAPVDPALVAEIYGTPPTAITTTTPGPVSDPAAQVGAISPAGAGPATDVVAAVAQTPEVGVTSPLTPTADEPLGGDQPDATAMAPAPRPVPAEVASPRTDSGSGDVSGPPVPVKEIAVGGVLAATGALAVLRRRRRVAMALREVATTPAPVPGDLQDLESDLHETADETTSAWFYTAMQSLADHTYRDDGAAPILCQLDDDLLEVLMSAPVTNLADPWVIQGEGTLVTLDRATPIDELDLPLHTGAWSTPSLVTIGENLIVNLEAMGVLSINGSDPRGADLARAMIAELKTSPSADLIELRATKTAAAAIGVDDIGEDPSQLCATITPWADHLAAQIGDSTAYALRTASSDPIPPLIVVITRDDLVAMDPVIDAAAATRLPLAVVVLGAAAGRYLASIDDTSGELTLAPFQLRVDAATLNETDQHNLARLFESANEMRATTVFADTTDPDAGPADELLTALANQPTPHPIPETDLDAETPAEASQQDDSAAVADTDEQRRGAQVNKPESPDTDTDMADETPAEAGQQDDAAAVADIDEQRRGAQGNEPESPDTDTDLVDETPAEAGEVDDAAGVAITGEEHRDAQGDKPESPDTDTALDAVWVGVLGAVNVHGIAEHLTPQQTSLVTYLAIGGPATADVIKDALWPHRLPSEQRWGALVTSVRQKLGRHRFPEAASGEYTLVGVDSDLGRFQRLISAAGNVPGPEAIELLSDAVNLIRGVPFATGVDRYWNWLSDHRFGMASATEVSVIDACVRLAVLAKDADNLDLALHACQQGLKANSCSEILVRQMADIYHAKGHPDQADKLLADFDAKMDELTTISADRIAQ